MPGGGGQTAITDGIQLVLLQTDTCTIDAGRTFSVPDAIAIILGGNNTLTLNGTARVTNNLFSIPVIAANMAVTGPVNITVGAQGGVTSTASTAVAIDLTNVITTRASVVTAGTILGGILMPPDILGNILTINGGRIAGAVRQPAGVAGTGTTTLTVGGNFATEGDISGKFTISVNNVALQPTLTVRHAISQYDALANSGNIIMDGGSLSGAVASGAATSTFTVNKSFTTGGTIGAGTMTVNRPAIFTANHDLTVATGFRVAEGATTVLNGSVLGAGAVTNNGTIAVDTRRTIAGNFQQTATGTLMTTLSNSTVGHFGQLDITGTSTAAGNIAVLLPDQGVQIKNGDTFTVMTSTGALTYNALIVTQLTPVTTLSFTVARPADSNNIVLTAHRIPYAAINDVSTSPVIQGMAAALQNFENGGGTAGIQSLVSQLNTASTSGQVQSYLLQLTPDTHINGAQVSGGLSHSLLAMNQVTARLDRLHQSVGTERLGLGYAAGDVMGRGSEYGPMIFGNTVRQRTQNEISGYTATTTGLGFFMDAPVRSFARLGAAVSYAATNIRTSSIPRNTAAIAGIQGMLYGSAEYDGLFIDLFGSIGRNYYKTKRNIAFMGRTASGKFPGTQYVGKGRVGFTIPIGHLRISPLATLLYTRLKTDEYTETGAPGANLKINGQNVTGTTVGMGVRFMEASDPDTFLPELHVIFLRDLKKLTFQTTSQFAEGGPSFVSSGITRPQSGVNIGTGFSSAIRDDLFITGSYDFEGRKHFTGHSVSFKFRWLF